MAPAVIVAQYLRENENYLSGLRKITGGRENFSTI